MRNTRRLLISLVVLVVFAFVPTARGQLFQQAEAPGSEEDLATLEGVYLDNGRPVTKARAEMEVEDYWDGQRLLEKYKAFPKPIKRTSGINQEGAFRCTGLAPTRYRLKITRPGLQLPYVAISRLVQLRRGETTKIDPSQDLGPYTFAGHLLNDGVPAKQAQVVLVPLFTSPYEEIRFFTDDYGRFLYTGLAKGRYSVKISLGFMEGDEYLDALTVEGDTEQDLRCRQRGVRFKFKFKGPADAPRPQLTRAYLKILDPGESDDPLLPKRQAGRCGGLLGVVYGRFHGRYELYLGFEDGSGSGGRYPLPLDLNLEEGFQELELTLPDWRGE
ncbi:carboxypeptidase regulatory-like domain-containing protein [bacterium]|nr:carboxypeptidase regulatory-like domain-containing protein [bacterium]